MSMGDVWKGGKPVVKCGPTRTKQEFRNETDINKVMARYFKTGFFDHVSRTAPVFADVSKVGDYASVVRRVKAAEDAFMALPAEVRLRFNNDPAQLVSFLQDPRNREEAVGLGLVVQKVPAPAPAAAPKSAPKEPAPKKGKGDKEELED